MIPVYEQKDKPHCRRAAYGLLLATGFIFGPLCFSSQYSSQSRVSQPVTSRPSEARALEKRVEEATTANLPVSPLLKETYGK